METNTQQHAPRSVELVIERNMFYRDNYRFAQFVAGVLLLLNIVLATAIGYVLLAPPAPRYFPTTNDGKVILPHALSEPVYSNDYVLQWTANAARQAFSLDFIHWRDQLQLTSNNFTPYGWKQFVQQLKASNNLNTLIAKHMVINAEVTGAPKIMASGTINNQFAWKIEMPMLITFTNGINSIPQPVMVTLVVVRAPVTDFPQGIAINMFLMDTRSDTQQ